MENIVYNNKLYNLTKFIRRLPNAYKIIQEYSYDVGTEKEDKLKELFVELYDKRLPKINIDSFIDICAAPGTYSTLLLEKHQNAKGIGISLDPAEGGYEFNILYDDRYKKFYKNIYDIDHNIDKQDTELYDLCMASCIPYNVSAKRAEDYKIIYKSLMICLSHLKKDGILIINFSFKDIIFAINFVHLINKLFEKIRLFKSTKLWILQRTFYIIGYQYTRDGKTILEINSFLEDFDNFYNKYHKQLLPDIEKNELMFILRLFESDVFMPQIQTYMIKSVKKTKL